MYVASCCYVCDKLYEAESGTLTFTHTHTQVQACLASGYMELIDSILAIRADSLFVVFERMVFFVTGMWYICLVYICVCLLVFVFICACWSHTRQ